jgi:catechol 2,3-dioxygenase-like lactoylglutathione lyase family enzyme
MLKSFRLFANMHCGAAPLWTALCLTFCILAGHSQESEKAPALSIAHVAIRVADLSASRAFYSSLGYQEAFALDKGGAPTEAFFKINDRQFIELYPKQKPDQEIGFLHVCFEGNDLAAVNQFYSARGLHPTNVRKAGAGNLLFTMEGPEKQNIEFTQYMPGSRHTLDIGKHLGPDRIAESIVGVGVPMSDVLSATTFYKNSMQFNPFDSKHERADMFSIPGNSNLELDILDKAENPQFHLLLGSDDMKRTGRRLKALHVSAQRQSRTLVIHDPDGNVIVLEPGKSRIH